MLADHAANRSSVPVAECGSVRSIGYGLLEPANGQTIPCWPAISIPPPIRPQTVFCYLSPPPPPPSSITNTATSPGARFPHLISVHNNHPAPPVQAIIATRHTDRQDRIVVPASSIIISISQQKVRRKPLPLPSSSARPTRLKTRFSRPR